MSNIRKTVQPLFGFGTLEEPEELTIEKVDFGAIIPRSDYVLKARQVGFVKKLLACSACGDPGCQHSYEIEVEEEG